MVSISHTGNELEGFSRPAPCVTTSHNFSHLSKIHGWILQLLEVQIQILGAQLGPAFLTLQFQASGWSAGCKPFTTDLGDLMTSTRCLKKWNFDKTVDGGGSCEQCQHAFFGSEKQNKSWLDNEPISTCISVHNSATVPSAAPIIGPIHENGSKPLYPLSSCRIPRMNCSVDVGM